MLFGDERTNYLGEQIELKSDISEEDIEQDILLNRKNIYGIFRIGRFLKREESISLLCLSGRLFTRSNRQGGIIVLWIDGRLQ